MTFVVDPAWLVTFVKILTTNAHAFLKHDGAWITTANRQRTFLQTLVAA